MQWTRISLILCMFGFLKEFRPNEPFIYDYLTEHGKNFTSAQVIQEVYPVATYSNFATLILVFLLTDFLRYKPIIILCGVSGIATFILLILGNSIAVIQVVEFLYGLYFSTEVAYYTYIYAKVDKDHYQIVSSYTKSALLFGRFVTGVVAQLTISYSILTLHQLNYLTTTAQGLATIWAIFLPSVPQSVYFHRPVDETDIEKMDNISNKSQITDKIKKNKYFQKLQQAYCLLWKDFAKAYTNIYVLKWSLWWAAGSCGYLQVLSYSQAIWQTCVENNEIIYNGAIEAIYTILGGVIVVVVGKLHLNWTLLGEPILAIFALVEATLMFVVSKSYDIWIQYVMYITFGVIYHTMVTVCSFEVAKNISEDSFGLIFGINVFLGLAFQSVLTYIITSGNVLVLDIRSQFAVVAWYFAILGIVFLIMSIITVTKFCKNAEKFVVWTKNQENLDESMKHEKSLDEQIIDG